MSNSPMDPKIQATPASFNLRALINNQPYNGHQSQSGEPQSQTGHSAYDEPEENGEQESTGKKRKLPIGPFTRRKRAAIACQFCRSRKTKCDNVRPSCGFCVRQNAKCVYGEADWLEDRPEEQEQDGIGHQILSQLKDIKDMLQCNQPQPPLPPIAPRHDFVATISSRPSVSTRPVYRTDAPNIGPHNTAQLNPRDTSRPAAEASASGTNQPHTLARCESLLKWPVFEGIVPKEHTRVDSFLMDSDYQARHANQMTEIFETGEEQGARGIREDDFVPLCRKFLAHVHPRHPVLDGDELMRCARNAEEYGVKWDSKSCLVLMACALAAYTIPWKEPTDPPKDAREISLRIESQTENRQEADAYFFAAKKRMGLLSHSILDIQCLFLASMYEKYCLQPLQAWFHLREASSRLQAHLLGERQQLPRPGVSSKQHLEQRVFWSCWRAENEILLEAGLPTGGLDKISYPNAFPTPPSDFGSYQKVARFDAESLQDQRLIDEKGWCYYLAEISLRRAIDETIQVLYQRGESFWLQNQDYLVRHYYEFEQQISLWHQHLPAAVQFKPDRPTDTEFSYFLHGRFSEWQELVLRPIVYYVLHSPCRAALHTIQHAQKSIDLCEMLIIKNVSQLRHGGSWFIVRKSFLCACLILAVVLKPDRGLFAPQNWQALVNTSLRSLKSWGKDADDVWRMGVILDGIYQAVCLRCNVERV